MGRARILLADDHPGVMETVKQLLAIDFDVVAAVENGKLAVEAVAALDPDVVILDISMPVMNGTEAASRLRKSGSRAKVIFLTVQTQPDFVTAAFLAGALGYVLKPHLSTDLVPAIREVLEGRIFASPSLGMDETAGMRPPGDVENERPEPAGRTEARQ
jgi:DNA-binding NarL/FixJ family response regulator